jgi:hypothetical protein
VTVGLTALQTATPSGHNVIGLQVYSDASKYTTFEGRKCWPVEIRVVNIPEEFRHLLPRMLVGFLPAVSFR